MGNPGEFDPVLMKSVPLGWEFDLNFLKSSPNPQSRAVFRREFHHLINVEYLTACLVKSTGHPLLQEVVGLNNDGCISSCML